jgi:hypothetical protein
MSRVYRFPPGSTSTAKPLQFPRLFLLHGIQLHDELNAAVSPGYRPGMTLGMITTGGDFVDWRQCRFVHLVELRDDLEVRSCRTPIAIVLADASQKANSCLRRILAHLAAREDRERELANRSNKEAGERSMLVSQPMFRMSVRFEDQLSLCQGGATFYAYQERDPPGNTTAARVWLLD